MPFIDQSSSEVLRERHESHRPPDSRGPQVHSAVHHEKAKRKADAAEPVNSTNRDPAGRVEPQSFELRQTEALLQSLAALSPRSSAGTSGRHLDKIQQTVGFGFLTVYNDGAGLSDLPVNQTGMGLHIMRYRASMIGGTLHVEKDAFGDTVVRCLFPLNGKASTHER